MVMASKAAERAAVDEAPRERMRGFDEDDLRTATGSVGKAAVGVAAVYKSRSSGPTYKFHALQPLPVLPPGVTPGVSAARQRLKELAEDPAILGIMKRHEFQVGRLSEMPPEGQVGVSPECLMGLNKNAGQEILLRLRTDDGHGLRPYMSVIPVLLHELTHNVWSDHGSHSQRDSEPRVSRMLLWPSACLCRHTRGRDLLHSNPVPSQTIASRPSAPS